MSARVYPQAIWELLETLERRNDQMKAGLLGRHWPRAPVLWREGTEAARAEEWRQAESGCRS